MMWNKQYWWIVFFQYIVYNHELFFFLPISALHGKAVSMLWLVNKKGHCFESGKMHTTFSSIVAMLQNALINIALFSITQTIIIIHHYLPCSNVLSAGHTTPSGLPSPMASGSAWNVRGSTAALGFTYPLCAPSPWTSGRTLSWRRWRSVLGHVGVENVSYETDQLFHTAGQGGKCEKNFTCW